ncbi:MAG: hypothetical protein ACOCV2_12240, partial [Persicimonas sp.]
VIGVRVVDKILANPTLTTRLANQTGDLLADCGVRGVPRIKASSITIVDDYFGPDYGVPTDEGLQAIALADRLADLALEPTYTGKALAGLIGERDRLELADRKVVYWHTLNGVDLSDRIDGADIERDLPEEYLPFFEEEA